jgi:hypothetical protein
MFYSDTQSFLNFLRILNRLEVVVFARAVKLESPCISCFIKRTPMRFPYFKGYLDKIGYTRCIFKMSRNFTYEVV